VHSQSKHLHPKASIEEVNDLYSRLTKEEQAPSEQLDNMAKYLDEWTQKWTDMSKEARETEKLDLESCSCFSCREEFREIYKS
jgi:hypothetical protein